MIIGTGGISVKLLVSVRQFDDWRGSSSDMSRYLGSLFLKRFDDASKMSASQTDIFNQLSATFPPQTIQKWENMVLKWKTYPSAPNPYKEPRCGMLDMV
jgi:hypothetical protein